MERNWGLPPITNRSRDNLPNPQSEIVNPWVPRNGPSIDDLYDLFDFGHPCFGLFDANSGGGPKMQFHQSYVDRRKKVLPH